MMTQPSHNPFRQRVEQAAETVLKRAGSVGPLELLQEMRLLQPVHVKAWRQGLETYRVLQPWIQVGPGKFEKTIHYFRAWVNERGLRPVAAPNTRNGPEGVEPLQVTADGNPGWETFYGTHYVSGDLPEKKVAKLATRLTKRPELVVFEKVSEDGQCGECAAELLSGDFLLMEKGRPLCLNCADLDQLVFLPAGDTAMSRRARKHSSLAAVVVRFSRTRKRYERQGLLVTEAALARAEAECVADAPARAAARVRAGLAREEEDRDFVAALAQAIRERYPRCPADEARHIAAHTGRRNSGRVGRSSAGRALDGSAVDLAMIAHIRHTHTHYDELLMQGTDRLDARRLVREKIDRLLTEWAGR